MPEEQSEIHHHFGYDTSYVWSATVKTASAAQSIIGFAIGHQAGSNQPESSVSINPQSPIGSGGVSINNILTANGSYDHWTLIYITPDNSVWVTNPYEQSGNLPNPETGSSQQQVTVTIDTGANIATLAYSYFDGGGNPQQGSFPWRTTQFYNLI